MPLDERCQFRKMFRHFVMATPTHVFPTILPNIRSDGKRVVPVSALVVIANRRRDGIAVAVFRVGFRTVGFFCDFVSVLFMIDIVCSMFDFVKCYLSPQVGKAIRELKIVTAFFLPFEFLVLFLQVIKMCLGSALEAPAFLNPIRQLPT